MNIDLIKDNVTPAEGEHSVRTYYCTYYQSKLLGLEAKGFLGVTNKRVIFQANGTSNAGNSVIQSELPISDVSGISSYKGTYFSLGHLLGAFLLTAIASGIVTAIIGAIGAMSRSSDGFLAIGWITAIGTVVGSFLTQRKSIWRSVLAGSSVSALTALGGGSLLNSFSFLGGYNRSGGWEFILAAIVGIYALVCVFWYARRPTFSLAISSNGGSSTPISISGASGIGIFDVSAGKALNAEPAEEAEPMLKELGAIILDIQTLGDFGIDKWKTL